MRGVGEGLGLRDYDVVVVGYHDLGGGRWWWERSGLGFGRGIWSGNVAYACAPGVGDSVHEVVVGTRGLIDSRPEDAVVVCEGVVLG